MTEAPESPDRTGSGRCVGCGAFAGLVLATTNGRHCADCWPGGGSA